MSSANTSLSSDASDGSTTDTSRFTLSTGLFMNGTAIPNGTYKCETLDHASLAKRLTDFPAVLLRALKVTGDPTDQSDYESCQYLLHSVIQRVTLTSGRAVRGDLLRLAVAMMSDTDFCSIPCRDLGDSWVFSNRLRAEAVGHCQHACRCRSCVISCT